MYEDSDDVFAFIAVACKNQFAMVFLLVVEECSAGDAAYNKGFKSVCVGS